MSAANAGKKYLLIPAWILILAMVALGVVQSGKPTNLVEPSGFLFVLVGGIALLMISFPGNEILRALRDAFRSQGNETDIRASAHFWEAAGRSFLIVGVLRSILHLVMFLFSLRTHETGSIVWIIKELAQYLLAALYGILLAVICVIPCWKLTGKLQSRPGVGEEQTPASIWRLGWRFGAAVGYILFLSFWVWFFPHSTGILIALKPAVLVVLGGTIALTLFVPAR